MIHAISPLDGRYGDRLQHLSAYFSEFALMRARCQVELLYVQALDQTGLFAPLADDEKQRLAAALQNFTDDDYQRLKAIENTTKHDVKACELFLREKVRLADNNLLHFGLTSEDVNNLAYNLLFSAYLANEHRPLLKKLLQKRKRLKTRPRRIKPPSRRNPTHQNETTVFPLVLL
jgi:adenylosuccinate lyase